MRVIHFTQGATDKLTGFGSSGASFVPLADGTGDKNDIFVRSQRLDGAGWAGRRQK
jgi:hypothetical protein